MLKYTKVSQIYKNYLNTRREEFILLIEVLKLHKKY